MFMNLRIMAGITGCFIAVTSLSGCQSAAKKVYPALEPMVVKEPSALPEATAAEPKTLEVGRKKLVKKAAAETSSQSSSPPYGQGQVSVSGDSKANDGRIGPIKIKGGSSYFVTSP